MFIDKISLLFNITHPDHQKHIASQLMNLPKELDCGWFAVRGGAYKCAARLHAPLPKHDVQGRWSKDYVLLQADPRNGQGAFLRAEWNPARFSAIQRNHIFGSLDALLDLPPPAVGKGLVTRADIAIDFPGVSIGDYVFERIGAPYRKPIICKGALQTIYLGQPTSSGQTCVYDKAAHLGEVHVALTRVEVHSRPNRLAADLFTMANPFKKFRVYDVKNAGLHIGAPHQRTFARAAAAVGIQAVLSDFPEPAAKKMKAVLVASPASFWDPQDLWQKWPQAIQEALPSFGNPDHYGTIDGACDPVFVQSIAQAPPLAPTDN